jgi:hypothetical protein
MRKPGIVGWKRTDQHPPLVGRSREARRAMASASSGQTVQLYIAQVRFVRATDSKT